MSYRVFTDATADLPKDPLPGVDRLTVIPMTITLGGQEYTYGPGGNISVQDFYAGQRAGKFASTSQITPSTYFEYFEACLEAGEDILYLCFTSGMSGTYQTAQLCLDDLRERYPQRTMRCIDTRGASVGEGLLVAEAAQLQAEGMEMDELENWVLDHRFQACHWFTVDTFEHLKRGGRVSAAAAVVGTALQIKPMLRVSEEGVMEVVEKPRGSKRAMDALLGRMRKGWKPELSPTVFVGHGDCSERAEELRHLVQTEFPGAEIHIADIGPVIGSHTGPGMLALVFWGTER